MTIRKSVPVQPAIRDELGRFIKGVSGNPLGSPKRLFRLEDLAEVATKTERLERLSKICAEDYKEPITARDAILAISEINKMLGDYAPEKRVVLGDIIIEVIYRNRNTGTPKD